MAEFVASLIGIASLGAKESITLHQVVSTLKSAQNDARLIAADISIFTCTLTQLSKTISNCNVPEAAQLFEIAQVLVPACSALINELHKLIGNTELYQMKGAFWMHVLSLRFRWLLNGPKVAFVKSLLESFKSTLVLLISTMDLAVVIHQEAQYEVKESLKSQVRTNLHLAEDAKANLLLFKDPRAHSDTPTITEKPDDQSTTSDAPSTAMSVINSPGQPLVPYDDYMPDMNGSVALRQLALEEEINGTTCLSECPQELSGILVAQQSTMKLAEDLLKMTHVPTWTWRSPAATKPTDLPKQGPSAHRGSSSDRPKGSAPVSGHELVVPSHRKLSHGQGELPESGVQADDTAPADPLDPLQYLGTEEDSQQFAPGPPKASDIDLQDMIRKVLEETLASRSNQNNEQLGVGPDTATQSQKHIFPETPFKSDMQDGTERLSKLERFMLAERDEMIRKAALVEADREAQKKQFDADKLAKLGQLILVQQKEQLRKEEAAEAKRKAQKLKSDAEKLEKLEKLILAQKEERVKSEEAIEAAKLAHEVLEKAKKAAEEEAEKLRPSDVPKPPIRFKDAVGRKFSFPWHLCKTWKGMEELIKQAFLNVEVIGPHVHEGHYDLVDPDGEIILPQVWETVVQPDWAITMHMWPMPEPLPLPPGDLDKPEKGQSLKAGLSKLFERRFMSQDNGKV